LNFRNFANKKAATPWNSRLTACYIQIVAAFWRSGRDSNPRAIARKPISSYLEAKEPEFRRRILSSPRFRNHSHMLTPTHQPKRSQLRRYSVEKQSPFS